MRTFEITIALTAIAACATASYHGRLDHLSADLNLAEADVEAEILAALDAEAEADCPHHHGCSDGALVEVSVFEAEGHNRASALSLPLDLPEVQPHATL